MTILGNNEEKRMTLTPENNRVNQAPGHSGKLSAEQGGEQPYKEFQSPLGEAFAKGKMPLPDGFDKEGIAREAGLLSHVEVTDPDQPFEPQNNRREGAPAPDDIQPPVGHYERTTTAEPERRKGWKKMVAVGAAVLAALGIGAGVLASQTSAEPQPTTSSEPAPGPSEEAPGGTGDVIDPNETEAPEIEPAISPITGAELPTIESLEISAEQSNEAIAQDVIDLYSAWGMAGVTSETIASQYEGDNSYLSTTDYAQRVAVEYGAIYGQALYGEDYLSSNTAERYNFNVDINAEIINLNLYGTSADRYEQAVVMTGVESILTNPDGTTTYLVNVEVTNNSTEISWIDDKPTATGTLQFTTEHSSNAIHLVGAETSTLS